MEGDCYEVAGRIITDLLLWGSEKLENPVLVHGIITGQGPIEGVHHGHAWIEFDKMLRWPSGERHPLRMALDKSNGKDVEIPAEFYRKAARVISIKEYTPEETRIMILKYLHWGPWEEEEDGRSEGHREGQRLSTAEEEGCCEADQELDPGDL